MKNLVKKYLTIFVVFVISFFISNYFIKNVFLGNSPRVNPYYLSNLKNQVGSSIASVTNSVSSLAKIFQFNKQPTYDFAARPNALPNEMFKSVAVGVAAHDREDGGVDYRIQPGTKVTIKDITLPDGRVVKGIDITGK